MIALTMIRHGSTPGNEEKRYIGATDQPLAQTGIEAIEQKVKKGLYPKKPDRIIVSPLKRCIQTAELIYGERKFEIIDALKEMDFGIFEGKNFEDLKDDAEYKAWVDSNCTLSIREGESMAEFTDRVMQGFYEMMNFEKSLSLDINVDRICDNGKSNIKDTSRYVVMVVHGGTIMAICHSLLGGEYFSYYVENGDTVTLYYDRESNSWRK